MGTFQDLQRQNPQIQSQYQQWARQQGATSPNWQQFRQYVQQQGQPDPGQEPSDLNQVHQQLTTA